MQGHTKVKDGYEYEAFAASELKRMGFRKIRLTPKSGDYGVDLLASQNGYRYAVQCKYYAYPVDGAAVQQAVAGMAYYDCDRAMVVTNSTFTDAARELAQANDVELLERVEPNISGFWSRRRPWELVLFAVQCVVFGMIFQQMLFQQTLSWKGVGMLVLLCFPVSYLAVRLLGVIWKLLRQKKKKQE